VLTRAVRDGLVIERRAAFTTFCTGCGRELSGAFYPFCPDCGSMSDVRYDMSAVELRDTPNPYHRFIDLLPVADASLLPDDATFTPAVHARRLGAEIGMSSLYLKDETKLPTGTTKDRMAAIALAYLYECGVHGFTTSSTGNSSTAYGRAIVSIPGLTTVIFTASAFRDRLGFEGNDRVIDVVLEDATFVEAFAAAGEFAELHGFASERGFFNPGRREGLKIAWLEAAEQVPQPIDWYVQAVSSAMGVYGVHKAAHELYELGLSERLPSLLCVQQETCAPMVSAWRAGSEVIRPEDIVHRPTGIAAAILRGDPTKAYPPIRERVIASGGTFTSVSEQEIRAARTMLEELEGVPGCFSSSAALAGLIQVRRAGAIGEDETVLVNITGSDRTGVPPTAATRWLKRTDAGWDLESLHADLLAGSPVFAR
jgi:threonine synthase